MEDGSQRPARLRQRSDRDGPSVQTQPWGSRAGAHLSTFRGPDSSLAVQDGKTDEQEVLTRTHFFYTVN